MSDTIECKSWIDRVVYFFLSKKLMVFLLVLGIVAWGLHVMPFDLGIHWFPRNPIPVDAIPDIGENQQIVFTEWMGRSPQDVEDQITFPLSISLQGIPGVKTIRSNSMFGFSSIYVIFHDSIDFYWARSRVLERLPVASSLLPKGVVPTLGPDATGLGQIFWYTLEGRDPQGKVTSGWSLEELRSIQDWYVRYALQSTEGVSEVASIGGFVKEYQIDVDPLAMRHYDIQLKDIFSATQHSNIDIGAKTIEFNGVEYLVRGIGFIKKCEDLENIAITTRNDIPVYIKNVARVSLGPAFRPGALDKQGAEVVGGVAVVRYGENPMEVIARLKTKIDSISSSLPKKTLADGTITQLTIVPYYDRTNLIKETLGTLSESLINEILLTIVVVILFLMNLRISFIISLTLPLTVLISFCAMSYLKIDSNLMSLGGIAIAIGTVVDMGIIMSENISRHYSQASPGEKNLALAFRASSEVGSAVLTAILTTVVGFIPVFGLEGPEGKMFKPLAYTKTFALIASVICALTIVPALCHIFLGDWKVSRFMRALARYSLFIIALIFSFNIAWWLGIPVFLMGIYSHVKRSFHSSQKEKWEKILYLSTALIGITFAISVNLFLGLLLTAIAIWAFCKERISLKIQQKISFTFNLILVFLALYWMTQSLMPLGIQKGIVANFIIVGVSSLILAIFLGHFILWIYRPVLTVLLEFKGIFMGFVFCIILAGILAGFGFESAFAPLRFGLEALGIPETSIRSNPLWVWGKHTFKGLGKEFMPPLDEGSYLFMPVIMPHGSIGQAMEIIAKQDIQIAKIPEVETVVGKIGRVESALDPAPPGMFETVIHYKPEYSVIQGKTVRNWRSHIKTPDDIWKEIVKAAEIPGATSAPKLQPIMTRIIMLQTGMRAPMGIKIKRSSTGDVKKILREMEEFGFELEKALKEVPGVESNSVVADRIVGKPYLEIKIDREKIARYGVNIQDVQDTLEMAVGGIPASTSIEGRERYPIRIRYQRELRDSVESLERILVASMSGAQIPLTQVATIEYIRGPEVIKSEDGLLVSYVLFDKKGEYAEVSVVENAQQILQEKEKSGELKRPFGTTYDFDGNYKNQVRSEKRFQILIPICLFIIFLLIYFQFNKVWITLIVFIAIPVTLSGGFILLWLYSQPWFLDISVFGISLQEILHIQAYKLSVAVWVGFIIVFGIATDDGVVMGTYLETIFANRNIHSIEDIRSGVMEAGMKRIRPCLMTTTTTILALLGILMSSGRGSDVMIPMALPSVGGMIMELITLFIVPVCYCWVKESAWKAENSNLSSGESQ